MQAIEHADKIRNLPEPEWRLLLYDEVTKIHGHMEQHDEVDAGQNERLGSLESTRDHLHGALRFALILAGGGGLTGLLVLTLNWLR